MRLRRFGFQFSKCQPSLWALGYTYINKAFVSEQKKWHQTHISSAIALKASIIGVSLRLGLSGSTTLPSYVSSSPIIISFKQFGSVWVAMATAPPSCPYPVYPGNSRMNWDNRIVCISLRVLKRPYVSTNTGRTDCFCFKAIIVVSSPCLL